MAPRRTPKKPSRLPKGLAVGKGQKITLAEQQGADNKPVWIHIATEGTWAGHPMGPLEWDREFFDQVVANFRNDPQYEAKDGVGCARVVPFDYEHASEMDATSGSIPVSGAPAPAWAIELEAKDGDDGAELWALSDLGTKVREQITSGGYQFTSVAIWPDAVDSETKQKLGPKLTSIAFTNHPFIKALQPIAARAQHASAIYIDGEAESPEEMLVGLRNVFKLEPEATADQIRDQLGRLSQVVSAGADSLDPALDEDRIRYMVGDLKRLTGMPELATMPEIELAVGQFLDSLPQPQLTRSKDMPIDSKRLAKLFKCDDDEVSILTAAEKAAGGLGALSQLMDLFGSSETKSLVSEASKALAEAKKGEKLVAALTSLAETAGNEVEDEDAQAEAMRVAASFKGTAIEKLAPKIVLAIGLSFATLAKDRQDAEAEVEAALAGMPELAERLRPTLLRERREAAGNPKLLAEFRKNWPAQDDEPELKSGLVTGPGGRQVASPDTGSKITATANRGKGSGKGDLEKHPLQNYPGNNPTEKTVAYLRDKQDGFGKLHLREQFSRASNYLRSGAAVL